MKLQLLSPGCEGPEKWRKLWNCNNLKDSYTNLGIHLHLLPHKIFGWIFWGTQLEQHLALYYTFIFFFFSTASAAFLFPTCFSPFYLNIDFHFSNPPSLFLWAMQTNPSDVHNAVIGLWIYSCKCIWTLYFTCLHVCTLLK